MAAAVEGRGARPVERGPELQAQLASWLRDLTESAETMGLASDSALLDKAPALRACLEGFVTGMSAQG
eukprot:9479255-Pyramimonas_sp.AAC.1